MDNIVYSIIIPHKNIPELLQRCLDSIPIREDVEVIVVDNNSSPEIVDFEHFPGYERPDFLLVRDNESKGAGGARNTGVAHAKGKWVLFIDADDLFNNCIGRILDDYQYKTDYDVVFFDLTYLTSVDPYVENNGKSGIQLAVELYKDNPKAAEKLFRYKFFYPVGKLINRQLFTDSTVFFEDSIIMNDVAFSYRVGFFAQKIAIDERKMQSIVVRQNSVSRNQSIEAYLERIRIKTEAELFYWAHHIPLNYLGYNNFLFFFKMIILYPSTFFKGINVMHQAGKSYAHILMEMPIAAIKLCWRKIDYYIYTDI